jgi:acyl-CoA thioester hydrolase
MTDWPYSFTDRVRYGDLDTNRHLNNVAVHQFFESARVAYFHTLFPGLDPLERPQDGTGMIFAETHVRFASPGFYLEPMRVDVRPQDLRRSSVKIAFRIVCEADERLVAEGWGTLVGFDYAAGKATPLPEPVVSRLREDGA